LVALRPPNINLIDQPDEDFSAWQSPLVQRALSQVRICFCFMAKANFRMFMTTCLNSMKKKFLHSTGCLIDDYTIIQASIRWMCWLPIILFTCSCMVVDNFLYLGRQFFRVFSKFPLITSNAGKGCMCHYRSMFWSAFFVSANGCCKGL
jgi:hypothetical protein